MKQFFYHVQELIKQTKKSFCNLTLIIKKFILPTKIWCLAILKLSFLVMLIGLLFYGYTYVQKSKWLLILKSNIEYSLIYFGVTFGLAFVFSVPIISSYYRYYIKKKKRSAKLNYIKEQSNR